MKRLVVQSAHGSIHVPFGIMLRLYNSTVFFLKTIKTPSGSGLGRHSSVRQYESVCA